MQSEGCFREKNLRRAFLKNVFISEFFLVKILIENQYKQVYLFFFFKRYKNFHKKQRKKRNGRNRILYPQHKRKANPKKKTMGIFA